MAQGRVRGIVFLMVATLGIGVGGSGCKLLNEIRKTQKHAAIAFDEKTGGWGYSFDQPTEDIAKKEATKECKTCTTRLT